MTAWTLSLRQDGASRTSKVAGEPVRDKDGRSYQRNPAGARVRANLRFRRQACPVNKLPV